MIHIKVEAPPKEWLNKAEIVQKKLLNAKTEEERKKIIKDNEYLWRELTEHLSKLSHNKCWYSEAYDSYSYYHVDHFRPKSSAIGIDKKDHGGYWWLAFDWTNYRLCGGVGNVRKKDKFAVKKNKANSFSDSIDDEYIYFLDPIEETDVNKLTFNEKGEIKPIYNDGWYFERANYTIENLNLNYKSLKDKRKLLWAECFVLIEETQKLLNTGNINPSQKTEGQIKIKFEQLRKLKDLKSPFSSTIKACLKASGLEWAMNL